jgi:hypothetical protein
MTKTTSICKKHTHAPKFLFLRRVHDKTVGYNFHSTFHTQRSLTRTSEHPWLAAGKLKSVEVLGWVCIGSGVQPAGRMAGFWRG